MGDLQAWLPHPNGTIGGYNPPPSPSQPSNPHPSMIRAESWRQAEQATQEIIHSIQPTLSSEQRRWAVIEYVQNLVRGRINTQVLSFGSVPLKTYLPDGDIDLTALGVPKYEDALASEVCSILEAEGKNKDAEFQVKDVQYIHAEVRLVKCLVQNIVVDISFNQIGGLCTLCFLEQVDRHIGKNNLFKCSIILIKAWCYYESRILGAHHNLISTYALETMVLYIFHLFHSSLDDPLAVLYRFLDYYSKFDWDNYCVSLHGPISISSLPELVAEAPENDGSDLLLTKEFLRNCVDVFSDPQKGSENNSRNFPLKHLNIVDPLKENNNLGRSVSKGNFYRIRSAFTYGARKLGRILVLPAESIADEISMFFMNTLDRHGSGDRPDVLDGLPSCRESTIDNHHGIGREDMLILGTPTTDSRELCKEMNKINITYSGKENGIQTQLHRYPSDHHRDTSWQQKCTNTANGNGDGIHLHGDGGELGTSPASNSGTSNGTCQSLPSNTETCDSSSREAYHAPCLFFPPENGVGIRPDSYEAESPTGSTSWYSNHWNAYQSECLQPADCSLGENEGIGSNGGPELNNLVNLIGDYDTHFRSLLYAQGCREYMLGTLFHPIPRSPSHFRNKYSWDAVRRRGMYTHMNGNGMVPGPPFAPPGCYMMNPPAPPLLSGAYGMEDTPKPRGTGTYFPIANYCERRPVRGRSPVANQLPRPRNNGRPNTNIQEKGNQYPYSQAQLPVSTDSVGNGNGNGNGHRKLPLLEVPKSSQTTSKGSSHHGNGFLSPPEGQVEFGSFGPIQLGASTPEAGRRLDSVNGQGSGLAIPASTLHRQATSSNPERPRQTYHLKNDDDFPPLNG